MSDMHEEDHSGPVKTPAQLLVTVAISFIAPVFIIIGLVYYVTTQNKPAAGADNSPEAVAVRLQKVGITRQASTAQDDGGHTRLGRLLASLVPARSSPRFVSSSSIFWTPPLAECTAP